MWGNVARDSRNGTLGGYPAKARDKVNRGDSISWGIVCRRQQPFFCLQERKSSIGKTVKFFVMKPISALAISPITDGVFIASARPITPGSPGSPCSGKLQVLGELFSPIP